MSDQTLENLLNEDRIFPPSSEFAATKNVGVELYDEAAQDRLGFWEKQASFLQWEKPWTQTLDWAQAPVAKWFVNGELNVSVNCVDRHVAAGHGSRVAIHFEGEPGDGRSITYKELQDEVCRAAN